LAIDTYRATARWPAHERFGLVAQARRSAFSTAANIAEGSARRGRGEFRRFLDISLGSLSELAYIFQLARDLDFLSNDEWAAFDAKRDEAGKCLWGLYRKVRS
jgi:four helix bundle protein